MIEHRPSVLLILILCLLLLTACSPPPTPGPADTIRRAEATAVTRTQMAELVEIAAAAANSQPYLPALPTAAFTPSAVLPGVETAPPNLSIEAQPILEPSLTPAPQPAQPVAGLDCYRAQFVADVTISDNTAVMPGQTFTKTWRLKNAGSCPWQPDTQAVFVDGAALDGIPASLGQTVEPGQTADISVQLTAPNQPGVYRGLWMLANPNGRFGLGEHAGDPFWVQVLVAAPPSGIVYRFAEHVCEADWRSATTGLPCPGQGDQPAGFVLTLGTPKLENRQEDELGLWTSPNHEEGGWISGTFPPYVVQPGDHFVSDIGCLADYPRCNVDFRLSYRPTSDENLLVQLGSWHETYDGSIQRIDFDLSSLAGQEIKLILAVVGYGPPGQNAAFWLVPSLRR